MVSVKVVQLDFNHITHINGDLFTGNQKLIEVFCNSAANMSELQENIMKIHKQEFLESIHFLCTLETPESLLNSKESFSKLDYVSYFSNRFKIELFQLVDETKQIVFIKFLSDNIRFLMQDIAVHMKKFKPYFYDAEKVSLKVLELLITIAKNLSISYNFCKQLVEKNSGISLLLSIVNSEDFKIEIPRLEKKESKYEYKLVLNIYGYALSILYNILSKTLSEYSAEFVECNAFASLIKASSQFENTSDFRLKIYLCLASLFADNDVSQLANVKQVIKELVDYCGVCSSKISENKMERCPISFENRETELHESVILAVGDSYFYLIDFLNVLYNFAVSDEIKHDIYEVYQMKNHLSVFIRAGNSIEREHALKLIMQLSYDSRVRDSLIKEKKELIEFVGNLLKSDVTNKGLLRNANGFLWVINKGVAQYTTSPSLENVEIQTRQSSEKTCQNKSSQNEHIMISYNSKSRPLCLSIKVTAINITMIHTIIKERE